MRYPFEIAAALGGPLVIPIPDMSYRKYLLYALDAVPQELRDGTLAEFDKILDGIADLYLKTIAELQEQFQIERFLCVHRRDPKPLDLWYEKRAPHIERGKVLRSLTRLPEKNRTHQRLHFHAGVAALPVRRGLRSTGGQRGRDGFLSEMQKGA